LKYGSHFSLNIFILMFACDYSLTINEGHGISILMHLNEDVPSDKHVILGVFAWRTGLRAPSTEQAAQFTQGALRSVRCRSLPAKLRSKAALFSHVLYLLY